MSVYFYYVAVINDFFNDPIFCQISVTESCGTFVLTLGTTQSQTSDLRLIRDKPKISTFFPACVNFHVLRSADISSARISHKIS